MLLNFALLPEAVSLQIALTLIIVAFFSALLTAALGAGGGLLLLLTLSMVLPAEAIIPVHGLIQLGTNFGRASLAKQHIHWPTIAWFLPGSCIGAAVGGLLLVQLPPAIFQVIIAIFVLYLCWGPKLSGSLLGPSGLALLGCSTSFLSLFIGASGPLVSAFLKQCFSQRFTTVATIAAALSFQHGAKLIAFFFAGFIFTPWLPLAATMVLTGVAGTSVGLRMLAGITETKFQHAFSIVLSLLALRLLWQAAAEVF